MIRVIFKDSDNDIELGSTLYTDIIETLIPSFHQTSHDMFLTKKFVSKPNVHSWQIKCISVEKALVVIVLKAIEQPFCVAAYAKKQSKSPMFFLKKYRIVEVDFGYHTDTVNQSGHRAKNKSDSSALLPGELHKKRPCIVLSARGDRVQVAPLSTKVPAQSNPMNVPVTAASFNHMARRYQQRPSVILLDMIQTVSTNRIFAPKAADGKYHPHYTKYNLCSNDKEKLKEALASQYIQDVNNEKNKLTERLSKLSHEKGKLLETNHQMKAKLIQTELKRDEYEAFILKIGDAMGFTGSVEEIYQQFH